MQLTKAAWTSWYISAYIKRRRRRRSWRRRAQHREHL